MVAPCSQNLLFIMQDFDIDGKTRIQKYGFHVFQQYKDELKGLGFYSDWIPYHFGPYSQRLADDLASAIEHGYVRESDSDNINSKYKKYSTTPKGRAEYRKLLAEHEFLGGVYEMIKNLQRKRLMSILMQIYADYPQYTVRSQIKGKMGD